MVKESYGEKIMKKKRLSWSQLGTFNSCKKRYYWSYIKNLEPVAFQDSLSFGVIFHDAMEMLYKEGVVSIVQDHITKLIRKMDTTAFTQKDFDKQDWMEIVLRAMVQGAYDYFYTVDRERGFSVVETEKKYDVAIPNPKAKRAYNSRKYRYVFIMDLWLVRQREDTKEYELVEYKTASRLRESYFERLKIDQQTRGMTYFLQREYGITISKIRYRILKKPGIRQTKKENRVQFFERLESEFDKKPDDYFIEKDFLVNQKQIKEFGEDLWMMQKELDFVIKNELYTKDTSKCSILNCPFLPLCNDQTNSDVLYKQKEKR
jgi:hypothetical protein